MEVGVGKVNAICAVDLRRDSAGLRVPLDGVHWCPHLEERSVTIDRRTGRRVKFEDGKFAPDSPHDGPELVCWHGGDRPIQVRDVLSPIELDEVSPINRNCAVPRRRGIQTS